MRMSSKFTRLVLAFVLCGVTLSGAKGGNNGGGNNGGGHNGGNNNSGGGKGGSGGGHNGGENQAGNQAQAGNQVQGGHAEGRKLASLKTVPVPGPTASELSNVVRDKASAIALGKAFFWEMQFGSDGVTACATCHFNAGADSRTMNQADPGLRRVDANGNSAADSTTFFPGFGPNHQLADPSRSNSGVISDNNNIVGSQGVFRYDFNDVVYGLGTEDETSVFDPVWSITERSGAPLNVRRSTPRNAPPALNAVV